MGSRTIVFLLLVVGGLAAVLLFTDRKPPAKTAAETSVLDGRSLRESKRIWWQFEGRSPVEIQRTEAGGFGLTEPLKDTASPGYLKQIFDAWDSAQMRAVPLQDDDAGRANAGLSPPELKLLVDFPDGMHLEIEVGAPGPLGATRFLRRDGKIWEGGDGLIESLRVGVEDLRDHSVFKTSPALVQDLRVDQLGPTGKRETLHLSRSGDAWQLQSPVQGRADGAAAMRFATAVLSLRVDDFVPGFVRKLEGDPGIVVTAKGPQGEETVKLWVERGQLVGQLPARGVTFSTSNRQYTEVFENAVEQLRARILVPLANVYLQLGDILVDPGQGRGERVRLTRSDETGSWRLVEPVEYTAGATPCNEAVQAINNLHAVEFVSGADGAPPAPADPQYGLGVGRLQVTVRALESAQAKPIELWFGNTVTKNGYELVYACRADEPGTVVLVPKVPVDHLRRAWTEYCDPKLVRLSAISRLDLARRTGERRSFHSEGEHWVQDGQPGSRDDVGSFANEILRDLDGRRVVDVGTPEFAVADWTVDMLGGNGELLGRMRVWERGGGRPLVVQYGDPGRVGFELAPIFDKQLRELWQ